MSEGTRTQRMLTWMRLVLEGETLSYEFFYDEEKSTVHPALGRMGFLMDPSGVRIRWVTTGADWTGLGTRSWSDRTTEPQRPAHAATEVGKLEHRIAPATGWKAADHSQRRGDLLATCR